MLLHRFQGPTEVPELGSILVDLHSFPVVLNLRQHPVGALLDRHLYWLASFSLQKQSGINHRTWKASVARYNAIANNNFILTSMGSTGVMSFRVDTLPFFPLVFELDPPDEDEAAVEEEEELAPWKRFTIALRSREAW